MEPDRLSCQFDESVWETCQSEFRKLPANTRSNPFRHKRWLFTGLNSVPVI